MRTTGRCRAGSAGLLSTSSSASAARTCQTTCQTNHDEPARTTPDRKALTRPLTCTNVDVGGSGRTDEPPDQWAHNPKVVGSNPTPATNDSRSEPLSGR